MIDRANGTMSRANKGPIEPAPHLEEALQAVADIVSTWPNISATVHWNVFRPTQIDGTDFYVDEEELGHIHLDGYIHLATSLRFGAALIAEGRAEPFPYVEGWVQAKIAEVGQATAVALFRRNYDRLVGAKRP